MKNYKILGTQHGITVTKPWSSEMYDHNDKVAELMKEHIVGALTDALITDNEGAIRDIAYAVTGHKFGFGYEIDGIHAEACEELARVQNYWLNQEYPWLVKMGYCPAIEEGFVGY